MNMTEKQTSLIGDFIIRNIKTISACVFFAFSLYFNYQANMQKIDRMETEIAQLRAQIEAQYVKLDNVKLDKAVFEATMRQFTEMSADIRQIRDIVEAKRDKF